MLSDSELERYSSNTLIEVFTLERLQNKRVPHDPWRFLCQRSLYDGHAMPVTPDSQNIDDTRWDYNFS